MTTPPARRDGAVAARGTGHHTGAEAAPHDVYWALADEVPVALVYNGMSRAVMMASPVDLGDFAVGFSLTEGIVSGVAAIEDVRVTEHGAGMVAALTVAPEGLRLDQARSRSMEGRSGCGLCGVEHLHEAVRPPASVAALPADFDPMAVARAVDRAFADLRDHQPLNRRTRSVHAAAWCDLDGTVRLAREDVGRHNALDKLIGALAMQGCRPAGDGFIAMTSRCSFELVHKAAAFGAPLLATLSAPTALALELAREAGMALAARGDRGPVMFR